MKESTRVLVSLGAAVGIGSIIAATGSASLLKAADFIAPVGTMWVSAIRMTVIPLVVSLLITGIASASDMRTVGRLGGKSALVFILMLLAVAAVAIPLSASVFALLPDGVRPPLPPGAAEQAGLLAADPKQTFATWLTSLIPTNPFAAAANGAMVPLIIFTLLLSLAIANSTPASRNVMVGFFQAVADAMLVLVRWIISLAPIGIFALLLPLAAHAGSAFVGAIGFYIIAYSAITVFVVLLLYPVVAYFGGIPMRTFARAALPAQLIAFSSSSSVASLPALVESAEQGLGLPKKVTGFVLPLAVSTFKLAAPVSWTIGSLFVAWYYNVQLGPRELGTVAFAAVFLAFAGPGIPRGAWILLTPLFVAIGLPPEGIGILLAVDAIPDTFATVLNVSGDLAAAAVVSRGENVVSP